MPNVTLPQRTLVTLGSPKPLMECKSANPGDTADLIVGITAVYPFPGVPRHPQTGVFARAGRPVWAGVSCVPQSGSALGLRQRKIGGLHYSYAWFLCSCLLH